MDELSFRSSGEKDLTSLQQLSQAVLHTVEASGPDSLTSADVLYLSQRIDTDLIAAFNGHSRGQDATEVMVTIATNYVKTSSLLLEPGMAKGWMGQTEDGVSKLILYWYYNVFTFIVYWWIYLTGQRGSIHYHQDRWPSLWSCCWHAICWEDSLHSFHQEHWYCQTTDIEQMMLSSF